MLSYFTIITILLLFIWLIIFISRPILKREMIILGILAVFILPLTITIQSNNVQEIQNLFNSITILDLIFSFTLAGIAGVIFHIFFGKHYHELPQIRTKKTSNKLTEWWLLRLLFSFLFFVWTTIFITIIFDFTIAISMLISGILLLIYIISHRYDLLIDSLASGLLTGLIVFTISSLASIFTASEINLYFIKTNSYLGSVPVDLLIWSFALGLILGPIYEYTRRIELK